MKRKRSMKDSLLYRYRYPIALVLITALALFMGMYKFWLLPNGLSATEIASATISGNFSLSQIFTNFSDNVGYLVNLPWTLLQSLSINIFDATSFAFRLPAVVIMLLTVAMVISTLRHLMRPTVAVMGGIVAVSSSFMIGLSRSGIPATMTTCLLAVILGLGYVALNYTGKRRMMATSGLVLSLALLSYMTAGFYIVLGLVACGLLHPRLRLVVKRHIKFMSSIAGLYVLLIIPIIVGLIMGLFNGNSVLFDGLFNLGSPKMSNLVVLANAFAGLNPCLVGGLIVPMLSFVGLFLAIIGFISIVRHISMVRSYIILAVMAISTIASIFNPDYVYLMFIPTVVLVGYGLGRLSDRWYDLFPNNPYARVFALLPLTILIGSISYLDISRYFAVSNYNSEVVYGYNQTYWQARDYIIKHESNELAIVVNSDDVDFYKLLMQKHKNVRVLSSDDASAYGESDWPNGKVMILPDADVKLPSKYKLSQIRTSWHAKDNLLLSVYDRR